MAGLPPIISIITPSYNRVDELKHLYQSLKNQSVDPSLFEFIVSDDGSTDSTKEIIKNYPEVILINNKINSGNGASVKKGILRTTKEYLVLLDADGQHPPKAIKRLLDHAIENDYDLVVASRKGKIIYSISIINILSNG